MTTVNNVLDYAPLGLLFVHISIHRALPYAVDCKAFSLILAGFGIFGQNNI